ncbi:MAG: hypothetical protein ACYTEL_20940 [Planctomycetota bacterium]|jgi:hypothetical protein
MKVPLDDSLDKTYQAFSQGHGALREELISRVSAPSGQSRLTARTSTGRRFVNNITKSRAAKLAAAAAIIIAILAAIKVFTAATPETDVRLVNGTDKKNVPGQEGVGQVATVDLQAKLKAESEQIEKLYAAGDTDGLVAMLSQAELELKSKVVAANYLAEIGDFNSVPILEQLDSRYGGSEPAFAEAIKAIEAASIESGTKDTTSVYSSGPSEQAGDQLLQLVPAESLLCLCVNNFDYAFGMLDQFLVGASPLPAGTSLAARMLLAGTLGDPSLSGIDTEGNFAVFALPTQDAPTEDMYVAALLPVPDYAKFLADNANCGRPDTNGVSIIKSGGAIDPNKTTLVMHLSGYALVGSANAYDELVAAAKSVSADSTDLRNSLNAHQIKAATATPFWAYANLQRISEQFGPLLTEQLDKTKTKIDARKEILGPAAIGINMWLDWLRIVLEEMKVASLSIRPQPHICNADISFAALPRTYMARMFVGDSTTPSENEFLGYLQNGAILNLAMKMNRPFWEEWSMSNFDLISLLSQSGLGEATAAKLEDLVSEGLAAAGKGGAISFSFDNPAESLFSARHLVEVKDAQKWNRAAQGVMDLWNTAGLAETFRNLGIESSFELQHGVDDHNGIPIDGARLLVKATDPNSDYGKIIDEIYAGGFDYRWATVDRLWVSVLSCDCYDAKPESIHKLIDEVRAGPAEKMSSEVQAAVGMLAQPAESDFVGTFNFVRYLNMLATIMEGRTPPSGAISLPKIDIETGSNLAFAGTADGGKVTLEIALPKEHLMEIKAVLELILE